MREFLNDAIDNLKEYQYRIGDQIFLMGRIEHLLMIKDILCDKGYTVSGILDNDRSKQGLVTDGLIIRSPEDLRNVSANRIIIIIYSPKYSREMVAQCEKMGYMEGDRVFVVDKPSPARNRRLIDVGLKKYEELKNRYGDNVYLFYADCPRGDYYLLSLFIDRFIQGNHIDNYVYVSHSSGLSDLSSVLGLAPYENISVLESRGLTSVWQFLGEKLIRMLPMTLWQGDFRFNPCLIRQRTDLTFLDTFRYMIFGLEEESAPAFKGIEDKSFDAGEYCSKKGLKKGKSVLISPFSYSLQSLPKDLWVAIAERASEKGYSVAVNTGSNAELNFIPNAVTINLSFSKIIRVMEYLGFVIGMRSGFFDVTCTADCNRMVLYPKTSGGSTSWNPTGLSFCSLNRMNLCHDATEIEISDYDEMIKEIDGFLPDL